MKYFKQGIIGFLVILILTFITCNDNNEKDDPKEQSTQINNLFGGNYSAIVKAYLTDTEWNGVTIKIENALNALNEAYESTVGPNKGRFGTVFFGNDVIIIIEKNPSNFTKWKTITDGKTMYIAFNNLDNDLQKSIFDAVVKMSTNEAWNL